MRYAVHIGAVYCRGGHRAAAAKPDRRGYFNRRRPDIGPKQWRSGSVRSGDVGRDWHKTIETSTIWTEGLRSFTGTPMAALLQRLGITSGTIQASAINDYTVEIPVADLLEGHALLAWHLDGQPMSVRQKGPLWIVYPYDSDNRFQSEIYFSRSIWQLARLTLVP